MLPLEGAEHGVSGELLAGNPSGRPWERNLSLGYVSNVPRVIPRSVSEATVNPSRASLRTPDQ
jgi:hypothetical protein